MPRDTYVAMRFLVGAMVALALTACTKDKPRHESPPAPSADPVAVPVDASISIDAPIAKLPSAIKAGFHRHDRAADPPLWPGTPPAIGQQIKLQINLSDDANDGIGWLAMGGSVTKVISPTKVEAELVTTTDQAPKAFGGVWRATLELDHEYDYPWVLTAIEQIAKTTPAD